MKFGALFTRIFDGDVTENTTLGTDSIDVLKSPTEQAVKDCTFSPRVCNINGFPGQRICVAYMAPESHELTATLYVYDETSSMWFKTDDTAVTMKHGTLTYFDVPVFADMQTGSHGTQGSLDCYLVVDAGDDPPDGTYTFCMGLDISSPGL